MFNLANLCLAIEPVKKVSVPNGSGVVLTHQWPNNPHICTLGKGHVGKHRCGLLTNEVWIQYCYEEWEE